MRLKGILNLSKSKGKNSLPEIKVIIIRYLAKIIA